MPLVLGRARRSWRGATGGADHIRSSLSVVLTDAAPVSTAAVASSRPREHPEGPPSAWSVVGGCYIKNQVSDPIVWCPAVAVAWSAPRARAIKNEVLVPKTLTRVTHSHSLTHIIASAMTEARSSLNKTHATQNTHGTQKTYASGSGKACATHAPTARRTGRAMPGLSGAKERRRPPACRAANSAARRHVTVTPRGMLTRRRARSPCCLPPSSWASLVAFGFGVGGGVRVGSEPGPGLRARAKGVG